MCIFGSNSTTVAGQVSPNEVRCQTPVIASLPPEQGETKCTLCQWYSAKRLLQFALWKWRVAIVLMFCTCLLNLWLINESDYLLYNVIAKRNYLFTVIWCICSGRWMWLLQITSILICTSSRRGRMSVSLIQNLLSSTALDTHRKTTVAISLWCILYSLGVKPWYGGEPGSDW